MPNNNKDAEMLYDTNTKVMNALKQIVRANPKQCILHGQELKDNTKEVKEVKVGMVNLTQEVKDLNNKLFVTNGEICMAENLRNIKGKVNRHIGEHNQHEKNKKWGIGTIIAIIAVMIASVAVLVTAYSLRQDKKAMVELKAEIIKAYTKP